MWSSTASATPTWRAVAACEASVKNNPQDERGYFFLGQAHFGNGAPAKARAALEGAVGRFDAACRRCKCCDALKDIKAFLKRLP